MSETREDWYHYFGVRGMICKRDYCQEEAKKFGYCLKHLEEMKSKKRHLKAKMK
jgi:hypothetical protein